MRDELISIGMPVFNEVKFIDEALESILSQDYSNFEVLISDNLSDDGTYEKALQWSKRDERVKVIRPKKRLSAVDNFRFVFERTKGRFFMWVSGHDRWRKDFISKCYSIMREFDDIGICYGRTIYIDEKGKEVGKSEDLLDTRAVESPLIRYHVVIWGLKECNIIYGLMRREFLKRVDFLNSIGPDNLIISQMSLISKFFQVDDFIFFRRILERREKESLRDKLYRLGIESRYPYFDYLIKHFYIVARSGLPVHKKVMLFFDTLICLSGKFNIFERV